MKAHHLKHGEEYRYTQKFIAQQRVTAISRRRFIYLDDYIHEGNSVWYLFRWKMEGRKQPMESYFSEKDLSTIEPA